MIHDPLNGASVSGNCMLYYVCYLYRDVVSCQYTDLSFLLAAYVKLCCELILLLINSFTYLLTYLLVFVLRVALNELRD